MITGVIIHLENDLPVLVDLEEMPAPSDRFIRCTNVRTVDGKRPSFVHDRHSTFIFPLEVIRMIEALNVSESTAMATSDGPAEVGEDVVLPTAQEADEEPDEDLLARIREI